MEPYYYEAAKEVARKMESAHTKRIEWLKYLLTVCIALFGALISLHPTAPNIPLLRWCFSISSVLLAFGILLISMGLYGSYELYNTASEKARQELLSAIQEKRALKPIHESEAVYFVWCRKIGYGVLLTSVVSFSIYLSLSSFS